MLPSKPIGLKWVEISLCKREGHIASENDPQAVFAWFLNNAEGEERFAAGANLFWFEEGIWP